MDISDVDDPLGAPARLLALRTTELLDTVPEEAFDRFTRLASRTVGAPVSLVSLIDADRHFTKAQSGLPAPLDATQELPLSLSLCSLVVRRGEAFVTADLTLEAAGVEFPDVIESGVRAYAGVPLTTAGGHALGSLCAIDFDPRAWTPGELSALRDIAAMVMSEIDLRSALRSSEARRADLETAAASIRLMHGALDSADAENLSAGEDALRVAADLAHELRTPLYAIRMLTEDVAAGAPEALRADLALIGATTGEALEVIDHQLDLARTNAGRGVVRVGPTEVPRLFRALRGMLAPLPRADGVMLQVEGGEDLPVLHTDGLKVAQILRNLGTNALRNTEDGAVRVSASLVDDGRCVAFAVQDTGIGIAPEDQGRIFGRFEQANDGSRADGTGLGLPLALRMAELVGGTITLRSEVGAGSTFTCTLPVRLDETAPGTRVAIPRGLRTGRGTSRV